MYGSWDSFSPNSTTLPADSRWWGKRWLRNLGQQICWSLYRYAFLLRDWRFSRRFCWKHHVDR